MVIAFFNLRLGWVLSGLVVPGYIVPIIILKPANAIIIVVEAIAAYCIVKVLFDNKRPVLPWSSVFGRDRFFSLVLLSILIRGISDGFLLPILAAHGVSNEWWSADIGDALHSFGLIVVALLANQFWKTGLRRGLYCFAVTTGITYLIVRFGLMELTNFRLGSMLYMYDDECVSISQSGKAYITLLLTSYVASRLNLYYSWDFNGILLPALLALQLFEPTIMLASFTEAWVVLSIGKFLLHSRLAEGKTIEGARKIVVFFTISFAYKIILGHVGQRLFPHVRMADYYGFGYLLPTLLAIKMYDKKSAARITRTTLQASLAGGMVACGIGFSILCVGLSAEGKGVGSESVAQARQAPGLLERLRREKALLVAKQSRGLWEKGAGDEKDREALARLIWNEGAASERAGKPSMDGDRLQALVEREAGEDYIYARKHGGDGLEGIVIVRCSKGRGIVVEAPLAASDWGTAEAAYYLFKELRARALYVHQGEAGGPGGVLRAGGVVKVRAITRKEQRALEFERGLERGKDLANDHSQVIIAGRIPADIAYAELREAVPGSLVCDWQRVIADPGAGEPAGNVELLLSFAGRRALRARAITGISRERSGTIVESAGGSAQAAVLAAVEIAGKRGENCYSPPTKEELRVLEDDIVLPILGVLNQREGGGGDGSAGSDFDVVATVARGLGMRTRRFRDEGAQDECITLEMADAGKAGRSWGTYVFRTGPGAPVVLEVPRLGGDDSLAAYSFMLFQKLRARALLIAGAAPECNFDGTADIAARQNSDSMFQTVHKNIARRLECDGLIVLEIRRPGVKEEQPGASWDVLAMLSTGQEESEWLESGQALLRALREGGARVEVGQRGRWTSGYRAAGSNQGQYVLKNCACSFGTVWVRETMRRRLAFSASSGEATRYLERLGIPTREQRIQDVVESWDCTVKARELLPELERALLSLVEKRDSLPLAGVLAKYPGAHCTRVMDASTGVAYFSVSKDGKEMPMLFNILSVGMVNGCELRGSTMEGAMVEDVRWGRCGYLYWGCRNED